MNDDPRLRPDGWPQPEHIDCIQEIEYLRARVACAEEVIRTARGVGSPTIPFNETALVYALGAYGAFLSERPDRWRNDVEEGEVWADVRALA